MKKFLVTFGVLSMTALLFTACNKGAEKPADEATPATTVEPVKTEETTESKDEKAVDSEVKVDAAAETKTETK